MRHEIQQEVRERRIMRIKMDKGYIVIIEADSTQTAVLKSWGGMMKWNKKQNWWEGLVCAELLNRLSKLIPLPKPLNAERYRLNAVQEAVDAERVRPAGDLKPLVKLPLVREENGVARMKMGSLFSGSGGFELAGERAGINTVWESEIEPFPMRVTQMRFPDAEHLGDISQINGAQVKPVDIVTGGSPCQNMSIAGNRTGLDGEQSVLFREYVRIVKEMRIEHGKPRFMVWENVPGAYWEERDAENRIYATEYVTRRGAYPATVTADKPPFCIAAGRIWGQGKRRREKGFASWKCA